MRSKIFIVILAVVLLAGDIWLGALYFLSKRELRHTREQLVVQQTNGKILGFAQLFIDKILLGEESVSFENRLKLENAVRDISDKEIFDSWQRFTNSQTNRDAQLEIGKMFSLLIGKIYNKPASSN